MNIFGDVAKLRDRFSGVWHLVHMFSMTAFITPYVWFIAKYCFIAKAVSSSEKIKTYGETFWHGDKIALGTNDTSDTSISLIYALWRYIVYGKEWRTAESINWIVFLIFLIALIYNIIRLSLFMKTKNLEAHIVNRGYYPSFNFNEPVTIGPWPNWKGFTIGPWKLCKWKWWVFSSSIVLIFYIIAAGWRAILFLREIQVSIG